MVPYADSLHTWESIPNVMSIEKNKMDHRGGIGILATAAGYAMKARPDPESTTSVTGTLISEAMKPRILKMTKPAKTDVMQLAMEIIIASL